MTARRRGRSLRRRYGHSRKLAWAQVYASSNFKRWRAARPSDVSESYDIWSPGDGGKFGMEFADSAGDHHGFGSFSTLAAAKEAAQRHDAARARFE